MERERLKTDGKGDTYLESSVSGEMRRLQEDGLALDGGSHLCFREELHLWCGYR
jgi:hypothetical protein